MDINFTPTKEIPIMCYIPLDFILKNDTQPYRDARKALRSFQKKLTKLGFKGTINLMKLTHDHSLLH